MTKPKETLEEALFHLADAALLYVSFSTFPVEKKADYKKRMEDRYQRLLKALEQAK